MGGVWRGREQVGDERGRQICGVGDREKRRERKRKEQPKLKTVGVLYRNNKLKE